MRETHAAKCDANLAVLQLHEHVMVGLQRMRECISFGSTALQHHCHVSAEGVIGACCVALTSLT